jgi:hypothetical protein
VSFGNAAQPRVPFQQVQTLSSGLNLITHNLNLATPTAAIVQICDATTSKPCKDAAGKVIDFGIVLETATSLSINSPTIVTNTQITIL